MKATYSSVISRFAPSAEFHQNAYGKLLGDSIPQGARWLDIGAGSKLHDGYGVPSPDSLAARADLLVGSDLEIAHLRENVSLTWAVGAAGEAMPFADATFDVITANMVLEHLRDPEAVLAEATRVLKRGGLFLFVTPNRLHPAVFAASVLLSRQVRSALAHVLEGREEEHIFPTYYRANSPSRIRSLSATAGLVPETVVTISTLPFLRRPLVLTALECLLIQALSARWLSRFRTNILGVLRKR